jgi:transcriptional regulator with XRE-family HTH domain
VYGAFIRQVRESAGLSQAQLAALVGTSQPTLSSYEHDRRMPSADMLNKLVTGCGFVLSATAGARTVLCPFPEAGWFPLEEPWPPPPTPGTDRPAVAPSDAADQARQLEAVLDLSDAVRSSKAQR